MILDYPKKVSHSPTAIFTMNANSIFSHSPSLTHTLSLSLSLWQLALFPLFLFKYKYDDSPCYQIIDILTINICRPNSLSHLELAYNNTSTFY
jgi:hypothetical protein